ncbi:hypothetical protein OG884_02720 [Streptosporangium sp. NBC_01755]|uniref:hypothetical protein n=1 Tax=unclassified Streptosporangium TaxID=2632669 RepID=UPI002DDB2F77|nr:MULTISPECIES: hypothetical protein [unclassified Streptosporangium]WSA27655.1 hypothetical protein OIE13_07220 [Streptosporangium sp. NBC_01810]WSD00870.1 hypothetical protein OG884_02720 [Streptosporangium sp. NBC_01755]
MEYILVAFCVIILVFLVQVNFETGVAGRVLSVLLAAFAVRLAIHVLLIRNGGMWYGGDNLIYEIKAMEIVEEWRRQGFDFVVPGEGEIQKSVALPCNLFAIVIYLCGGKAPLACTALVALVACALCIVIYRFARLLGADERAAFLLLVLSAFTPAFLVHTSDMFKDGFSVFLVVACLGLSCSNMQRFDMRKLFMLVPFMWALWHVRPYMVFMCMPPLLLSLLGSRRALSPRIMTVFAMALVGTLYFFGDFAGIGVLETMEDQLEYGQSDTVRRSISSQDSGVTFADDGNPWGALGSKLLYTLLSPFPWTEGSMMLQLGKIEAFIWYFLLYSAVRGARRMWCYDRRMLFVLLLFIVPGIVAYATTMGNIGLIFRQRMPILMVTSVLSAVAWTLHKGPEKKFSKARVRDTSEVPASPG